MNPLGINSVAAPDEVVTTPPVVAEPEVCDAEPLGEVAVGIVETLELPLRVLRGSEGATMLAEEEFEAEFVVIELD